MKFRNGRALQCIRRVARGLFFPGLPLRLFLAGASIGFFATKLATGSHVSAASMPQQATPVFPHGLATRGCTQEDAPALELYFTKTTQSQSGKPQPPYLRFEISSRPDETFSAPGLLLSPLRRDLSKPSRIVRGQLVESESSAVWLTGTLVLTKVTPNDAVHGHYTAAAPNGQRFEGNFTLPYSKRATVCG